MRNIFLIDFENVGSDGLSGILNLNAEDRVIIFYSTNSNRLTMRAHILIGRAQAQFTYYEATVGGKNALDHQLSTYLGYLIGTNAADRYYIVSRDNGYRYASNFWNGMLKQTVVFCIDTIKNAQKITEKVLGKAQEEPTLRTAEDLRNDDLEEGTGEPIDETEASSESSETPAEAPAAEPSAERAAEQVPATESPAPAPEAPVSAAEGPVSEPLSAAAPEAPVSEAAQSAAAQETPAAEPVIAAPAAEAPAAQEPAPAPAAETAPAADQPEQEPISAPVPSAVPVAEPEPEAPKAPEAPAPASPVSAATSAQAPSAQVTSAPEAQPMQTVTTVALTVPAILFPEQEFDDVPEPAHEQQTGRGRPYNRRGRKPNGSGQSRYNRNARAKQNQPQNQAQNQPQDAAHPEEPKASERPAEKAQSDKPSGGNHSRTESRPGHKPEPRQEHRAEGKAEAKSEARAEASSEPKAEANAAPRQDGKSEHKPEGKPPAEWLTAMLAPYPKLSVEKIWEMITGHKKQILCNSLRKQLGQERGLALYSEIKKAAWK